VILVSIAGCGIHSSGCFFLDLMLIPIWMLASDQDTPAFSFSIKHLEPDLQPLLWRHSPVAFDLLA